MSRGQIVFVVAEGSLTKCIIPQVLGDLVGGMQKGLTHERAHRCNLPVFLFFLISLQVSASQRDVEQLLDMDFFDLVNVRVSDVGSLTETTLLATPAAVTRITAQQIAESGARSMLELLEITIPGAQVIRNHYELPHLGVRGITSDKEDKIMIRVNGRVMNERIGRGAITERDFPMMRDIHHIDGVLPRFHGHL